MSEPTPDHPFFPGLICVTTLIGVLLIVLNPPLYAQSAPESPNKASQPDCEEAKSNGTATASNAPVYKPPRRGAPKTRVGGGTRNADSNTPSIELIAPISTGLTTKAKPTLFWHLSDNYEGTYEFVVIERDSTQPEPLFRKRVSNSLCAGFHLLDLGEHDVELAASVTYQWSVVIIRDTQRRSQDIVAQATLERVVAPDDFQSTPQYLADNGIWYDAIEAADPTNTSATNQAQLRSLLEQVDLKGLDDN